LLAPAVVIFPTEKLAPFSTEPVFQDETAQAEPELTPMVGVLAFPVL
jgi:hypothetical protein